MNKKSISLWITKDESGCVTLWAASSAPVFVKEDKNWGYANMGDEILIEDMKDFQLKALGFLRRRILKSRAIELAKCNQPIA